jgi:hypothetical protein
MRRAPWLFALLLIALPHPARADVSDSAASYDPGPATVRSDFVIGTSFGPVFGTTTGYPNELAKIGIPQYQQDTGFIAGSGSSFWLGGALRDWFVFGIGLKSNKLEGGGKRTEGGGLSFHFEAFPLFARGGVFRDLALVGEFGAGSRKIVQNDKTIADGGLVSSVAFGVHWEPLHFWHHLAGGPILVVTHEWSESVDATYTVLAFQLNYYGGP